MPVNVVKKPEEEIAWKRAKARAREQYPQATGERFYRIVMAIYKKMTNYQPNPCGTTGVRVGREVVGDAEKTNI
ncbi:MAG: hypothetical protein WAN81_06065 [Candidatus Binataceae bacterium]